MMSDSSFFPVLDAGAPEGGERLARLRGRVAELERLESSAAREKTIEAFGRPLSAREVVTRIVTDIRERGDEAVLEYSRKLDGVELSAAELRVPEAELDKALSGAPAAFVKAAKRAAANIRAYQKRLVPKPLAPSGKGGISLGAQWNPVECAACYVPGGTASYPSSVLMNAVPAQVAGVERIVLAMPPGRLGAGNPLTLAAAALVGAREVYRVGGAQAVAAFAFGTDTIPKADVVIGPGNLFVMLAKREVFGHVNIDMLAGPSEILVIADDSADPRLAAVDLLSQAEHDPMASAILVTTSREVAEAVRVELGRLVEGHEREGIARESLSKYGLALVVGDMKEAIATANAVAPEHLELLCRDAPKWAKRVRNAGAVFVGPWSPESLGDYAAGPSHTLPTGGSARFMSGLSPLNFMKRTSVIAATREGLKKELSVIDELARADGLPSHADSARRRFDRT
jgi:histidinol dehydrogenase